MASPGAHLDFSDLKQSEAVNLLLKHAHQDLDNNNQQLAFDIVDALGCQALAVAQLVLILLQIQHVLSATISPALTRSVQNFLITR